MRVAVNTRLLLDGKLEGIGWFTFETLKRVTKAHPEVEFFFFFDRKYHPKFLFSENITPVVLHPQARHPLLYCIWFEYSVTRALKKYNIDLFVSPDGYISLSTKVPTLAVIHDLNFEHFSKDLPKLTYKYYRYFFPKFARKAKRIATVSDFSRKDIQTQYGIEADKIDVVYNGVNEDYHPLTPAVSSKFKEQNTAGSDYFVFVGALHPRKNVQRLFSAFDLYKKQNNNSVKLLIVGKKYWFNNEIHQAWDGLQHKADVVFTGRLNGEELNQAIGAALAMVFVPYFEGFGIPILEAFKCDVPVICSNCTSMPEVAGDAALYVDPFDSQQIAAAMAQIQADAALRDDLIAKGRKQLEKFSWDQTAAALWTSILRTVSTES